MMVVITVAVVKTDTLFTGLKSHNNTQNIPPFDKYNRGRMSGFIRHPNLSTTRNNCPKCLQILPKWDKTYLKLVKFESWTPFNGTNLWDVVYCCLKSIKQPINDIFLQSNWFCCSDVAQVWYQMSKITQYLSKIRRNVKKIVQNGLRICPQWQKYSKWLQMCLKWEQNNYYNI